MSDQYNPIKQEIVEAIQFHSDYDTILKILLWMNNQGVCIIYNNILCIVLKSNQNNNTLTVDQVIKEKDFIVRENNQFKIMDELTFNNTYKPV